MRTVVAGLAVLLLVPAGAAAGAPLRAHVADSRAAHVLRTGRLRVALHGTRGERVRLIARIGSKSLARPRTVTLAHRGRGIASLHLRASARKRLRAALARCRSRVVTLRATARGARGRTKRRLSGGGGCTRSRASAVTVPGQ